MSQNTSGPLVVVRPRDRAIICNAPHGAGRCRKKVASDLGLTTCDNGHQIPITELLNAHLKEGLWTNESVGGIWPSVDAIKGVIDRITRPEFLRSTSEEWQHQIVSYWPVVSWLIDRAQHFDRKASATLKDFLEKEIRERFLHLNVYLMEVAKGNAEDAIRIRERVFRLVDNWDGWTPTPEDYLGLWEIHLEASTYLKDDVLMKLYQHNVSEAVQCIQTDGAHSPLYFKSRSNGDYDFELLPDPVWQWWRGPFTQIALHYRHDRGDVKWFVNHNAPEGIQEEVRQGFKRAGERLRSQGSKTGEFWGFSEKGSRKIYLHPPQEGVWAVPYPENLSHHHVIRMMMEIREELGGSRFGRHLKSE